MVMPEDECGTLPEKVKLAVGCRCERCGEILPADYLIVHPIRKPTPERSPDPDHLLVLCRPCHWMIRGSCVPEEYLHALVKRRSFHTRRLLRKVTGFSRPPYSPPDTTDLAELYREMNSPSSPILFRWAG
jgi:hypothetical protein